MAQRDGLELLRAARPYRELQQSAEKRVGDGIRMAETVVIDLHDRVSGTHRGGHGNRSDGGGGKGTGGSGAREQERPS